ncbi:unnamed protein product [Rhizophagus irregularis]|nr:unnamed protein product [Rhizophagus irregularis]
MLMSAMRVTIADMVLDRVKRVQNREGGAVNVCQVSQEESIEKLVRRIFQDNLSEMEVKAICKVLVESAYLKC